MASSGGKKRKREVEGILDPVVSIASGVERPAYENEEDEDSQDEEKAEQGLTWDPIICQWVNDDEEEEDEDGGTFEGNFQSSEAFLAALELHTREGCRLHHSSQLYGSRPMVFPSHLWIARQVAGDHFKPCDSCGRGFNRYDDNASYYFVNEWTRNRYDDSEKKLCLSCMDQKLYQTCDYRTDLDSILPSLEALRAQHKDRLGADFVKNYEEQYPGEYPVFFRHFQENDKGKADGAEREVARGVSVAMSKAVPFRIV